MFNITAVVLAARHLRVPVVNLGTPDYQKSRHLGSNVAGTAAIVRWFTSLARQKPNPAGAHRHRWAPTARPARAGSPYGA